VDARVSVFEAISKAEHERDKLLIDAMLRAGELSAKTGHEINTAWITEEIERDRSYRNFIVDVLKATAPEVQVPPGAPGDQPPVDGPPGAPGGAAKPPTSVGGPAGGPPQGSPLAPPPGAGPAVRGPGQPLPPGGPLQ
jgi:hypothetical protein